MLPEDLLRQASKRLGVACLVAMGLWVINILIFRLVVTFFVWMPGEGLRVPGWSLDLIALVMFVISV